MKIIQITLILVYFCIIVFGNINDINSLTYEHQKINENCPCFLEFENLVVAGFGHNFFEILLGIHFSYLINCTYLFKNTFKQHGIHGNYLELNEYVRLEEGEIDIKLIQKDKYNETRLIFPFSINVQQNKCYRRFVIGSQSCLHENKMIWCLDSKTISFEDVSIIAKEKFNRKTHIKPFFFEIKTINIVWHLRIGDISIHKNDSLHYETIYIRLVNLLKRFQINLFFIYECSTCDLENGFSFLKTFKNANFKTMFISNLSILQSFNAMVQSDILITSGSSFSYAAALLSKNIVIFTENKAIECPECYCLKRYVNFYKYNQFEKLKFIALININFKTKNILI